ncbi:hypothetical protein LIA77_07201 [Sarocladium implicatum]|nr:hypothetical protein LIA77_07201 [Sarocladium implicatum]
MARCVWLLRVRTDTPPRWQLHCIIWLSGTQKIQRQSIVARGRRMTSQYSKVLAIFFHALSFCNGSSLVVEQTSSVRLFSPA